MIEIIRKFYEYNDMEVVAVFVLFVIVCVIGGIYCIKDWSKDN